MLMRIPSGFIEHPTTNRLFEDKRLPYRFNDLEHSKKKKKTKGASKITFNLWDFNGRALQFVSMAVECNVALAGAMNFACSYTV